MFTAIQSAGVSKPTSGTKRRVLSRIVSVLAYGYLVSLFIVTFALYYVGESWWVTTLGLYAPRVVFALPLPFIVAGLWLVGLRRLFWTQVVAALLVGFPLMGFVMPWPSLASGGQTIRLLSLNVDSANAGVPAIIDEVAAFSPDIVLLEEAPFGGALADALHARYPFVESSTQFIAASRFPLESTVPPKLSFYAQGRSPRFMRYAVATPLGSVVIYCVHPLSPRGVLHVGRFHGALRQLVSGQLFLNDPEKDVGSNAGLRTLQISTAAADAAQEAQPVIIAGDTNLPGLSATLRESLSGYHDGFRERGWGLGYTFPSKRPFLRLDRILASEKLRFASFQVGCQGVSDHLCVVADIKAAP